MLQLWLACSRAKTTLEVFGITMEMVHSSAEDFAALAVATALLLEREGRLMHATDKVPREAMGLLNRTRMGATVDDSRFVATLCMFRSQIVVARKCCEIRGCPSLKPSIDKNTTRVAAIKKLCIRLSMVRAATGHMQYAALPCGQEFDAVQTTAEQLHATSECYAMCQVVGKIATLAQCNSCYLGGYRQVLLRFLEKDLDCDHLDWLCPVVDMVAQTAGQPANYVVRNLM